MKVSSGNKLQGKINTVKKKKNTNDYFGKKKSQNQAHLLKRKKIQFNKVRN